ncbi:MAG: FHA domain-containing protein [Dehalococcoidia bacterium]
MSSDTELLLLRLAFLALVFGFLLAVGLLLNASLRPAPSRSRRAPALVIVSAAGGGLRPGVAFPLAGTMLIGRDQAAGVYLPDASVSVQHAEVMPEGRGWAIRDLGSLNGTFVGQRQVTAVWSRLDPGTTLTVGTVELQLRDG